MPDFISGHASDNFRLGRSKTLYELADGTYNLFLIPKFAFVMQIWFYITQAYAGGAAGSATIGFTGNGETADPDGFMDATACGARATGYKIMTDDTQPGSKGKWFNTASGFLTITLAKSTDTTLLRGFVFVQYSVLH
jgi:hypothetical protein